MYLHSYKCLPQVDDDTLYARFTQLFQAETARQSLAGCVMRTIGEYYM